MQTEKLCELMEEARRYPSEWRLAVRLHLEGITAAELEGRCLGFDPPVGMVPNLLRYLLCIEREPFKITPTLKRLAEAL